MRLLSVAVMAVMLTPGFSWACACGCGVFDVGTLSIFPTHSGGTAFLEYNFMNQDRNWSGTSKAPAADNGDKQIRTDFYTAGCQYMFDRQWGTIVEFPYWDRSFKTVGDNGDIVSAKHADLGDIRVKAIYSGFSSDMSSGITLGLKLPTGDHTSPGFDRDVEIGTGSTDILLGAYTMGALTDDHDWVWFVNGQMEQPALTHGGYRPGSDANAVVGVYYDDWRLGGVTLAPVAQATASCHWHDRGSDAMPADSGYDRLLLAPGMEIHMASVSLYAEVAFPAYQHVNGDQLVAPELFTLRMAYDF